MVDVRRLRRRCTPRPLRRRIGARVIAGLLLSIAIAVAVAAISVAYIWDAGRGLARVTERDREVSADLRELEIAVEQGNGAVQNFLLSGDERDVQRFEAARTRFVDAYDRLDPRTPAGERGPALDEITRQAQMLNDVAEEDLALYRQGWHNSANFLWRTDGQQIKDRLLDAIHQQVQIHNDGVDAQIARSRGHVSWALDLSVLLVTLGAAAALLIGIAIIRAVTLPVQNLVRVANAVRTGDFGQRAPITGEDELASLSSTMNEMVDSLAESRDQLQQALAEAERSEERYRSLAESATDLIITLDRANIITFANPAVQPLLGFERSEVVGQPVWKLCAPGTWDYIMQRRDWVAREPRRFTADLELNHADGSIVRVEVNCTVLMNNGKATGILVIARDMTERHRMEDELRRLNAKERRRAEQMTTVNEVGRKLAALQPVHTLLPSLVKTVGRTFGYRHVRILLAGDDGDLRAAATWHRETTASLLGKDDSARAADEEAEESTVVGAPAFLDDDELPISPLVMRAMEGDAGFVAGSGRPEDAAVTRYTEVAVPVRTNDKVLGVLDIRADASSGMDDSDIFTLQTLADQIAVAIENARLFEAGQRLAVSEERNRLARELHDSVTQELFSMTMITGALPQLLERKPDAAKERVLRLQDLARGALSEMRALLFALRPAALAEEGLIVALTRHVAGFEHREGIPVHLEIDGEGRLPRQCEEAVFRVAQEALNNVAKHARASSVWVTLVVDEDQTLLSIHDDGVGLGADATDTAVQRMGMRVMRERVEELGGSLVVESAPGHGTTIRAAIPIGTRQMIVVA